MPPPGNRSRSILTKFLFAALCLAVGLFTQSASAQAPERIIDFHSEIWVHHDASMTVRETITVNSDRRKIKRGIFRDFPTAYKGPSGRRTVVGFELQEVLRDGAREPFHTEAQSNGIRIYIGSENVIIPAGRHVYRLTYRTDRQLGYFDDFDELFWNVTGNGWEFPIERARATVHLPDGASVLHHASYTGRAGERGQNFRVTAQTGQTFEVETTRRLQPREGLSIAVSWPRGFIQRPTNGQMLANWVSDNRVILIGVFGILGLLAYFLIVWAKVGRDPDKGPAHPRYEPPRGFSPASARYVLKMGFDDQAFTAAIVNMAVKGYLIIEEGLSNAYSLRLTGQSAALSKGEAAVAVKLFPGGATHIELEQDNHKTLQLAKIALYGSLWKELERIYFVRNTNYFLPGIGLSVLVMVLLVASDASSSTSAGIAGWAVVVFIALLGLNLIFNRLLKAPTRLGRRTMDEIEGFKDYLSVAEKDQMNLLNPPDRTPQLFEKYLPYALALGVEQQWAEQFSGVLSRAAGDPTQSNGHYSPHWYSGRRFNNGFADCASTLSSGFTGAISAASTAPGSSSGSSGGGSSGGGGGGGGGGGW